MIKSLHFSLFKNIFLAVIALSALNSCEPQDDVLEDQGLEGVVVFDYINGSEFLLRGQAETVEGNYYHRIDANDLDGLSEHVKELSKVPAGFNLNFQTNSPVIKLKWVLDEYKVMWNMTPLATNGFDLYGWNGSDWQYVSSAKPTDENNSVTLVQNLNGWMRHFKLYFPLYTGVNKVEIGVPEGAEVVLKDNFLKPLKQIVVYGSSITQGASASRPGMAYPSILSRNLNVETFNFGFSGSGKMDIDMAEILGKIDADLFVLDAVPNPSVAQIESRTIPFVEKLRELQPDMPILMVESVFRETGNWNTEIGDKVSNQNEAFRKAYEELINKGYDELYYIYSNELTDGHEGSTDGTHLSDLGMMRMADRIGQSIVEILNL